MLGHPSILGYLLLLVSENVSSADNQQERLGLVSSENLGKGLNWVKKSIFMGTYKVPENYDYMTGGILEEDEGGVLPGQLTSNTLNHLLFGVPISDDNPNKEFLGKRTQKRE